MSKKKQKTEEFPRKPCPTGTGNLFGYTVEARNNYPEPLNLGNQTFTKEWKKVHFSKTPIGVPSRSSCVLDPAVYGVLPYEAAQALRWWFHAEAKAHAEYSGLCLETRIIKHEIFYDYKVTAISQHEHVGGDGGDYPSHYPRKEQSNDT